MDRDEFLEQFEIKQSSKAFKKFLNQAWDSIKDLSQEEQELFIEEMKADAGKEYERRISKLN